MTTPPCQRAAQSNSDSGPTLHARMLATRLSAMLPGAVTVRVALRDPRRGGPRIDASALDEHGKRMRVSSTQTQIAARWIIRAHPEAGWQQSRAFNLRTAELDADGGR